MFPPRPELSNNHKEEKLLLAVYSLSWHNIEKAPTAASIKKADPTWGQLLKLRLYTTTNTTSLGFL